MDPIGTLIVGIIIAIGVIYYANCRRKARYAYLERIVKDMASDIIYCYLSIKTDIWREEQSGTLHFTSDDERQIHILHTMIDNVYCNTRSIFNISCWTGHEAVKDYITATYGQRARGIISTYKPSTIYNTEAYLVELGYFQWKARLYQFRIDYQMQYDVLRLFRNELRPYFPPD